MAGDVEAPQPTQPTDAQQRHEAQMLGYVLGLFFFYVLHDALQERAFRTPGFEFGWFMTAVEIGTMFVCALAWEGGLAALRRRREADETAATPAAARNYLALLVFAIALSQGTGSVALQHVNYPVKVAFKSCKLVPTMAFSRYIVRDGKRYGVDDYAAALFMCVGLALLSAADLAAHAERDTQAAGLMLLVVAVCSDAVIPNLQEKLLRGLKLPLGSMVVLSNAGSFLVVLAFIAATGELGRAVAYLRVHQDAALWLLAQGLVGYAGLRCYLNVIRGLSGVAGVLATSARKVVTLVLSFILFKKPFTGSHATALAVLAVGVGLGIRAKHRKPR